MIQELRKYIEEATNFGLSKEAIMAELLQKGWQVEDIMNIMMSGPIVQSSEHIISVRNVFKTYGAGKKEVHALNNVSLDVKKGGVTALLGPNGAGKTTLVRILSTLLPPTTGYASVAGFDVVNQANELRHIIGLAGQYAAVDEVLTGRENLEMVGQLYHLSKREAKARAQELLKQFDLVEAGDRILKTYSGGMRRRLDLAASIIIRPQVLFLDEPTTGLDPRSRFQLWNVIRDLVESGTTVLLTTQYLEEADQLANYIFVIDHGGIIAQGSPDELKQQVGGDILEIHTTNHADVENVKEALAHLAHGEITKDSETGIITMPVEGGAGKMVEVVRELDARNIKISNVNLRRPSLDDVFIKLTGHQS